MVMSVGSGCSGLGAQPYVLPLATYLRAGLIAGEGPTVPILFLKCFLQCATTTLQPPVLPDRMLWNHEGHVCLGL